MEGGRGMETGGMGASVCSVGNGALLDSPKPEKAEKASTSAAPAN
eukprot:CAMPEP_0173267132 /NCGR_PEP_ID=MMETSP1142-20121109/29596_1 /TAXON_ID=483371 /ORGANISM="non described non described, Strain CCMP2298" /LENGTH=44 /DNA_ID= /DNA_START= /DNA_END= /DNA_ORIENTATION=